MSTTDGLYRKRPGEGSWSLVDPSPDYVFSDVVVDPTCPTRVYASIGYFANRSRSRGGIDVSFDNGDTWTNITSGYHLHNVPIPQIVVDPERPERVLAATHGRGAWEFDWGTDLPMCRSP
ncbi:MAG: hypothetical protein EXQ95_08035 [Alphaproteobacteria bacterium]|nr:hypothetical protein [Alphaproteobacteria bacterium]